jgi:hypothetical protein
MKKLFELASRRHTEITKVAMLGAVLGAGKALAGVAKSVGGAIMRNPGKVATGAFTGMEVAGGARNALKQTDVAQALASGAAAARNVGPTM